MGEGAKGGSFFVRSYLHLENGELFEGQHFGFPKESDGEIVFTTGMTGYCQSLTDPSFTGQILTFTYPLIGNYGVPKLAYRDVHLAHNFESEKIRVEGVVVAVLSDTPSHYDSKGTFSDWLAREKVPGIAVVP